MPLFEILSICKGGGYRYCRTSPKHPKANPMGLYPLHRVLMENKVGRILRSDEHVHHKDEDKTNDDIENLELLDAAEHARLHRPKPKMVACVCPECGNAFETTARDRRKRVMRNMGLPCCSRSCGVKAGHKRRRAQVVDFATSAP